MSVGRSSLFSHLSRGWFFFTCIFWPASWPASKLATNEKKEIEFAQHSDTHTIIITSKMKTKPKEDYKTVTDCKWMVVAGFLTNWFVSTEIFKLKWRGSNKKLAEKHTHKLEIECNEIQLSLSHWRALSFKAKKFRSVYLFFFTLSTSLGSIKFLSKLFHYILAVIIYFARRLNRCCCLCRDGGP